jgi:L-threonylcarbamoyladenylate synthase
MIGSVEMLDELANPVPDSVRRLASALWPGKVTLRLPLSQSLPRKVYKELSKPDKKVGFRQPSSEVSDLLIRAADVPLLVSSANLSNKAGAASVAAIKKHFSRSVSLFIDSGDLPEQPPSTVLDFDDQGHYRLVRSGAVSEERIEQVWSEI